MGWSDRDPAGRLVVAKEDLTQGVLSGTLGIIVEVVTKYPDGTPCTFNRYDVFFSCGKILRLESIGRAFDFID